MTAPHGSHASGDGPSSRDAGTPTTAGTHTTKAVLVVVVAVVLAVVALSGLTTSHSATGASQVATTAPPVAAVPPAPTTTTTPPPAPASVKVLVFNGTTAPHGAGYFSTKLQGLSYDTLAPENATITTVNSSQVYVAMPGYMSSAANVAAGLGLPATAVQPSLPATAPVSSSAVKTNSPDVVVLVGSDISGQSLGTTSSTGSTATTGSTPTTGSSPTTASTDSTATTSAG